MRNSELKPVLLIFNIFHILHGISMHQGSKLTVASGKFATLKFRLLSTQKVGSKKLLPGSSVVKVTSKK